MPNCIKCKTELPPEAVYCHICGKKQVSEKRSGRTRGNGTGSAYKRGKTWEVAVVLGYKVDDNGKVTAIRQTKGGFKTKRDALEYIPTLRQQKAAKIPTLNDLWYRFKNSKQYQKLSDSRQEKYEIVWRKIENRSFVRIDLVTVSDIQSIVDCNAKTYYPARDIRDLLSKLYQLALPDQYVTINLAEYIELPDLHAKKQEAFSKDDITKLWNDYITDNWWTGYILLMIYTGMMPGELMHGLKSHVDWENKQIIGAGKKTDERRAAPIVLADVIIPVLEDLCEHTPGEKLIAINKDNFYARYYETLERAGCKRLPPYSCRHTAATELALENVPISVVQKIMRHAKITTTQQYIHVDIDPMLAAVNQMASRQKHTEQK